MLRYILAAVAALVLLTACLIPDDAYARAAAAAVPIGAVWLPRRRGRGSRSSAGGAVAVRGGAVAVRGGRYGSGGYGYRRPGPVRQRSARRLLAMPRQGPTTAAAAATTPMATGFATKASPYLGQCA